VGPTELCNQALARLGGHRINSYEDAGDTKVEAVYCRLFYEQTIRALQRSHLWRFAKARVQLSQDTTDPEFQWTYAYHLPADFLRLIGVYSGSDLLDGRTYYSYELEGVRLMTDESTVYLKYIKWVPEVPSWDALFTDLAILTLARKLVIPLSQDLKLKQDVDKDFVLLERRVRAMDRNEMSHMGREDLKTWQDARWNDKA